jgi:methylated-DNA-protein-cysteine methyltransferase-like protein
MSRPRRDLGQLLRPLSGRGARRARAPAPQEHPALQALWHVIAQIPRGRVATYGGVARAAGLPGRARQTAYALRMSPPQMHLPWHRVVGAGGRIVFPPHSRNFREQARRLRAEGVAVQAGRIARSALTDLETL